MSLRSEQLPQTNLHTEEVRLLDRVFRVSAGRVKEGHDSEEPPPSVLVVLSGNGQRADSASAELVHLIHTAQT
jgi:hypothetical protein